MRVLLTGAGGLIGSATAALLAREGHTLVAVVRRPNAAVRAVAERVVILDIATAETPEDWLPHLSGIDAVVNCAGVWQDGPSDSTAGVHVRGVSALFEACARADVRRIVHVSAAGVDRGAETDFSRTKLAGDEALMTHDLDWVVLRPSVVLGRQAYGGSALIRGLAALPVTPAIGAAGPLQVVHLDDLTATVLCFLRPGAPGRLVVEIVGPERLTMTQIVQIWRRWLGWPPAPVVHLPGWMSRIAFLAGDFLGRLGWRPPIRSTGRVEIARGSTGDAGPWHAATGIEPRTLEAALAGEPAGVQERWFARLYFLKPLAFAVLSLFWIATGLISLGPGFEAGRAMMEETGLGRSLASLAVVVAALADILIGAGIAVRKTARIALIAAIAVSVLYAVAATILMPRLWADPLGPMLKMLPIAVLTLLALAIVEDR